MRTTRDGFALSFIALGSLIVGCAGGQTGDLGGHNDGGEASGGRCIETAGPLASDTEDTPLGFSASALLERIEATHNISVRWGASDLVDFSPTDGTTNATISVDCPAPNARYVTSEPKPGEGLLGAAELDGGDACPDQLRVDCDVQMTTDDGGFDESWSVTVGAASLDLARVHHALVVDGFNGSFAIGEVHADNTEVKQLTLEMSLSRFGVSGSIASVLERRHDGAVSAGWVTYAAWPVDGCSNVGPNAFVVDENSDAGAASAAAIVEQLVPDAVPMIDWGGGATSTLSLTVDPESTGCVSFDPFEAGPIAYYPATVAASTADGRLDLTAEGELRAHFDADEALSYATIEVSVSTTSEQVAALMNVSVDEAEQLALEYDALELRLSQSFDVGLASGNVRLLGATIPECISNPPEPMQDESGGGAPGCMGIDQQVVFEGTWMQ